MSKIQNLKPIYGNKQTDKIRKTTSTNKKSMAPRYGQSKEAAEKTMILRKVYKFQEIYHFMSFIYFAWVTNSLKACFKNIIQATSQQNFKLL